MTLTLPLHSDQVSSLVVCVEALRAARVLLRFQGGLGDPILWRVADVAGATQLLGDLFENSSRLLRAGAARVMQRLALRVTELRSATHVPQPQREALVAAFLGALPPLPDMALRPRVARLQEHEVPRLVLEVEQWRLARACADDGCDVCAIWPTSDGKSRIFRILVSLGRRVLYVAPLVALVQDQAAATIRLDGGGSGGQHDAPVAVMLGSAATRPSHAMEALVLGRVPLTAMCPESFVAHAPDIFFLNERLRAAGQPPLIIVIDEVHATVAWQTWRWATMMMWRLLDDAGTLRPALVLLSATFAAYQVERLPLRQQPASVTSRRAGRRGNLELHVQEGMHSFAGAVAAIGLVLRQQLDAVGARRRSEVLRAWEEVQGALGRQEEDLAAEALEDAADEDAADEEEEEEEGAAVSVAAGAAAGALIVYAASRRLVEALALFLGALLQIQVGAYHAGMPQTLRNESMAAFLSGHRLVMVATTAFELGVNKADVNGVLVFGEPSTLSTLLQQFGRAGRGGQRAVCALLSADATAAVVPWRQTVRAWLAAEVAAELKADQLYGAAELTLWRRSNLCRLWVLERLGGEAGGEPCGVCDVCRRTAGSSSSSQRLCFHARAAHLLLLRVSTAEAAAGSIRTPAQHAAAADRVLVELQYSHPRGDGYWRRLAEQLMLAGHIALASGGPPPVPAEPTSLQMAAARYLWRVELTTAGQSAVSAAAAGCGGVPLDSLSCVQRAEAEAQLSPVTAVANEGREVVEEEAAAAVNVWQALSCDHFEKLSELPVENRDELLAMAALDERFMPLDERGRTEVAELLRDPMLRRAWPVLYNRSTLALARNCLEGSPKEWPWRLVQPTPF